MKFPVPYRLLKLFQAPTVIAMFIMGSGALASAFYLQREAARTEDAVLRALENEAAARHSKIRNELKRKRIALSAVGDFFAALKNVDEQEFDLFTNFILSVYGLQSVCWTSSDGQTVYINSKDEHAACENFDLLAPNKIIKQDEYGILLSSFTKTQGHQEGFVSIYLQLKSLIPAQPTDSFLEELVVSDAHTDEFAVYPLNAALPRKETRRGLVPWERFYELEDLDGIVVLYSTRLFPSRSVSPLSMFQVLPAAFLCLITTILGLFVRVLMLQKNRIAQKVAQQTEHLEEARRKAETAAKVKSTFLANMSHEIRTPLNGVLGMASLLLDSPLTDEQRSFVQAIHRSGDTLFTVINDILDLSKIEAGKLDFQAVDFSLAQAIQDVQLTLSLTAQQKNLEFHCEIAPDVPEHLEGDPSRLRQVLINLLGNAIKFTVQGSVRLLVSVISTENGLATLRFDVHDTGIGISKEAQSQIFTPFTQADPSTTRRYGGTGLGLSICKYLVERMNGEIGVQSEVNSGSHFWFTVALPIKTSMRPVPAAAVHEYKPSDMNGTRVLVVDDVVINQTIVKCLLEKYNCSVNTAANGREAIHMLLSRPYDLILMDCQMPEMDGYEATRLIRSTLAAPLCHVPIIAMTAHAMKGDAEKCLEAGMNDYMSKPIRLMDLEAKLKKWQPQIQAGLNKQRA
jgi:signal transduction histidine kinase/CheY-like chemotaxis protein